MSLQRAIQGCIHSGQVVTWARADGSAVDLSGATLTGLLRNDQISSAGEVSVLEITGTLTVVDSDSFTWEYSADDVSVPGRFLVQFLATFTVGEAETVEATFPEPWVVEELFVSTEEAPAE